MIQTIQDVEQHLATLMSVRRENPEDRLAAVARALDLLGNPQNKIPAIHIAGTSGKGSTAYYASELLRSSGYTVGLAVSPHVNSVAERSQVNGQVLTEGQYCNYFSQFVDTISELGLELSYIEFLTVFSYWLFAKLKLDYMVIEVGLGGRLDPTSTIQRQDTVRAITDIGLDHTEILGDTLAKIATEKAGIIHSGNIVVVHEQPAEMMDVILASSGEVYVESVDTVEGSTMPPFQQRNWTLAYQAVARRLVLDGRPHIDTSVAYSSRELIIPGRSERFDQQDATIILDAAHNPQKNSCSSAGC